MTSDYQFLILLLLLLLCVYFPSLGFVDLGLFIAYNFVGVSNLLVLKFSFQYYLQGWTHGQVLLKSGLSWNILLSPSMVIESFAGYSNLDCHLWSPSVCITPIQDLLVFVVSIEQQGIILTGLSLYVTWPFFLCSSYYPFFILYV